ncbi:MAG: hypothetical protein KAJ19_27670 [Gammaproteobacteria bacterium]|nr:hypothetical protein [Gammaproteobacteria bacterium]
MAVNNVEIDRLIITVEGKIDELEKAYKKGDKKTKQFVKNTEKQTKKLQAAWSKASKGVVAGLALIGGTAVLSKITKATASLANLQAQMDKLGVSAEFFQTFRAAGQEVANLDFRAVDMGLQRILRRIGDARNKVVESQKLFEGLGVDIGQSTEKVIRDTIDAISALDSAEERLSVTVKLVDSEAAGLVTVFSKTSEVLDVAASKAQKYGKFVDAHVIKKGAELDREYRRILEGLERRWQSLIVTIASGLDFSAVAGLRKEMETVELRLRGATIRFERLTNKVDEGASTWDKLRNPIDAFNGTLEDDIGASLVATETRIAELTEEWVRLNETMEKSKDPFAALGGDEAPAGGGKKEGGLDLGGAATPKVADFITSLEEELAILQMVGVAQDQLRAKTAARHVESRELTELEAQQIDKLVEKLHTLENAQETAAVQFKEMGDNMQEAFIDGALAGEDLGNMLKNLIIDLGKAIIKMALLNLFSGGTAGASGGLGGLLSSAFGGGGKAAGGTVRPGQFYEVNEGTRKEFFKPDVPGKIVNPNIAGQGGTSQGGLTVVVKNTFEAGVTKTELAEALPELERSAVASVMEGVRRGGVQRKTITGRR